MVKAEDILLEVAELKKQKSKDYQGGQFTEADYFPFQQLSFNHMIHTKYLRLRSVTEREDQSTVNFESAEDTLKDMIAYCAMNIAYLRNNPPQQATKPSVKDEAEYVDIIRGKKKPSTKG